MPDHETSPNRSADTPSTRAPDVARRRLLKGGAAAAPLVLAVTTRPARAAVTDCKSPSAFGSMAASGQVDANLCEGRSPGFWKQSQKFAFWPDPYYPETKNGHTATTFSGAGFIGNRYPGKTLLEVLSPQTGDALGRHIVAALLNAAKGWTPVLDVPAVLNIWAEIQLKGYYEPTGGQQWTPEQVVEYLKTTFGEDQG